MRNELFSAFLTILHLLGLGLVSSRLSCTFIGAKTDAPRRYAFELFLTIFAIANISKTRSNTLAFSTAIALFCAGMVHKFSVALFADVYLWAFALCSIPDTTAIIRTKLRVFLGSPMSHNKFLVALLTGKRHCDILPLHRNDLSIATPTGIRCTALATTFVELYYSIDQPVEQVYGTL
jgi:hypothetical protein